MDERGRYLAGIVTLVLGVLILAALVVWYDSRDYTLARENRSSVNPGEIRVTRTGGGGNSFVARVFDRNIVREETTFTTTERELNSAARAARNSLASRLGISTTNVVITLIENRDWPNSCLGLERAGEFCAQAIFSGFRVTMQAEGNTYSYRTNLDGSILRAEN